MKKTLLGLGLGLWVVAISNCTAATMAAQPSDLWVYIDGQYYQCSSNANGTTTNLELLGCKTSVEAYKASLKTCMDYYARSRLSSFADDCIRPLTHDFKANGKKECFFEAKAPCVALCLENYKNSRFISYQDCYNYCA